MRKLERASIVEEESTEDISVLGCSNDLVENGINELAAFLYHLYRGKQG